MIDLTRRQTGELVYLEAGRELYELEVLDAELGYVAVTSNRPTIHDRTRAFVKNSGGQPVIELGETIRLEFGNGVLRTPQIDSLGVKGRGWSWEIAG